MPPSAGLLDRKEVSTTAAICGGRLTYKTEVKLLDGKKIVILVALVVAVIVLFFFFYKRPSAPLSEDKFVDVYIQLSTANAKYQDDPLKLQQEKKRILKSFKVTPRQIEDFIREYQKDPEKWAGVWEKIDNKLEKLSPAK